MALSDNVPKVLIKMHLLPTLSSLANYNLNNVILWKFHAWISVYGNSRILNLRENIFIFKIKLRFKIYWKLKHRCLTYFFLDKISSKRIFPEVCFKNIPGCKNHLLYLNYWNLLASFVAKNLSCQIAKSIHKVLITFRFRSTSIYSLLFVQFAPSLFLYPFLELLCWMF